jgi:hypothetical protein
MAVNMRRCFREPLRLGSVCCRGVMLFYLYCCTLCVVFYVVLTSDRVLRGNMFVIFKNVHIPTLYGMIGVDVHL